MKKKFEQIVFFGSGPVAAASLRAIQSSFEVEAVITKPSTLREMKSILVGDHQVYTVNDRAGLDNLITSKAFSSQVGIIVDFGIIVSDKVLGSFSYGIVNSHFSLLPEWRGADPIAFAILSGQPITGVSLMLVSEKLDEGYLLSQKEVEIAVDATTPTLTKLLVETSNKMLIDLVPKYLSGNLAPYPQNSKGVSYSRKLTKKDGEIDWNKASDQIEREIRAFSDWPKSRTKLGGIEIIITMAHSLSVINKPPGTVEVVDKALIVHCGKGYLCIDRLKPAGKNEMSVEAFLAGYKDRLV